MAGSRLSGAAEQKLGMFCPPVFVEDRGQICFSLGSLPRFFFMCATQELDASMEDDSQGVLPAKDGEIKVTSSRTGAVQSEVSGAIPVPVPRKLTARGVNRNNNPFLLRLQSHQVGVWKEKRLSFACTIWIPSFWRYFGP